MILKDADILSLIATVKEEVQLLYPDAVLPESVSTTKVEKKFVEPACIDHTLLKATATKKQIDSVVRDAIHYGFASVCVNGRWVKTVAQQLKGTGVRTCAVVGFPLGAMSTAVKVYEAKTAVADGANEIDMVLSIGSLHAEDWTVVFEDVNAVVNAVSGQAIVKVILETGYLSNYEIVFASLLSVIAGAHFVKTSTGFAGTGATVHHVDLMRKTVGLSVGVKASGGIRTAEVASQMLQMGASRLGVSRGPDLLH